MSVLQLGLTGELTYRELITAAQAHLAKPPEGESGEAYSAFVASKVLGSSSVSRVIRLVPGSAEEVIQG